jgi:hypothetical protein
MEVDDIISYHDVVTAEKASLQKGMNYRVGKNYSVFPWLAVASAKAAVLC